MKKRARAWGLPLEGQPGTYNAITDVSGVEVGMTTLIDPAKKMQTGVTAILPRGRDHLLTPVWAGVHSFNGNGEMTGTHWIRDGGYFMSPIVLTNSHGVGVAHDAVTRWMIER
ncbi:MAG TPA: P1 family peptidase, partial [Savagea sp.]